MTYTNELHRITKIYQGKFCHGKYFIECETAKAILYKSYDENYIYTIWIPKSIIRKYGNFSDTIIDIKLPHWFTFNQEQKIK